MILTPDDLARCTEIAECGAGAVKAYVDAVADATGLQARVIYGTSRKRQVAMARQLVMFLAHRGGVSLATIGRALNRDHTTVLHGVRCESSRRAKQLET